MNENEYWVRFWLMAFTTIASIIIMIAITNSLKAQEAYEEEQLTVTEMKTLLDAGYVKKEIGCYKPMYSFVKDAR